MADAFDLFAVLAGHCRAAVIDHGSVMVSLFATGLIGSLSHCTSMCGPLVAAQSVEALGRMPPGPGGDLRRIIGAALLPYQLGRTTTYAGLGAILALPVGFSHLLHQLWWFAPLLLTLAALGFLLLALRRFGVDLAKARPRREAHAPVPEHRSRPTGAALFARGFAALTDLARPLFRRPTGWRGYALGLLLGFLPCGLLYTALMIAAATGDPLAAWISMVVFALGTFPVSWAIGFGSQFAAAKWTRMAQRLLPYLACGNALLLLLLAYRYALS